MARGRIAGRADRIGLRAAMADRLLPFIVAAMSFLAALALAGNFAAGQLAAHWLGGARNLLTIEVPDPGAPVANASSGGDSVSRIDAVQKWLQTSGKIADARILSGPELDRLLKPWLGDDHRARLPISLPGVIVVHTGNGTPPIATIAAQLASIAPETMIDSGGRWSERLTALTGSLRASAFAVLVIVAMVAASVVVVAVRTGLAQRRETIEIIHGLGAQDSDIANQFAVRAMRLAASGGLFGALTSLPVLIWLSHLASGFSEVPDPIHAGGALVPLRYIPRLLPPILWTTPLIFTLTAALIGWVAAQVTVHGWLRRLV